MPLAARVILTTYENLPALRLALRGYLRQTTREFGITVADDGSGPETRAFVADFRDEARQHEPHAAVASAAAKWRSSAALS